MRGSIRARGKGWQLRVHLGGGKYLERAFHGRKRDAEDALNKLLVEVGQGLHVAPVSATFADAAGQWIETAELAASTRAAYRSYLDTHLLPALGDKRLERIGAPELDRLYRALPLAPASVVKCHHIVSATFEAAIRWGWVGQNPARRASPPSVAKGEIVGPTPEVVTALIAAADPDFGAFLHVAAVTGARRGEVCGLQWEDVAEGQVTIRRSLEVDRTPKPPKTGRARVLAYRGLDAHRTRCAERALACGVPLGRWVFSPEPDSSVPYRPDSRTQAFARLCARAGVEGVRLHDLRHFAATQMLGAGIDPVVVAHRLGHARPSMSLDRYATAVPARDAAAADHLAALLA